MSALRLGLLTTCAARYRTERPKAECTLLRDLLNTCDPGGGMMGEPESPITVAGADFARGQVRIAFTGAEPPFPDFVAELVAKDGGPWSAAKLTCTVGDEACGATHQVVADGGGDDFELEASGACKPRAVKAVAAPK